VGKLLDGTKFDASAYDRGSRSIRAGRHQVIPGWTEGTLDHEGGRQAQADHPAAARLRLQGAGDVIPPNATLIFEIELVSINPK
jgi:FKBP-type peptidyl-prolyl cis-trans isomerase